MKFLMTPIASAVALVAACFSSIASANLMHISTSGAGQVLLFPYYTTRNDTVSLLSLVNTSVQGKAVRINVREARGGFVVARLNVYLSPKDVWTAAIISDADGARLVTNDVSCTAPLVGSGLAFGNALYAAAAASAAPLTEALRSRDRTREGYIEVIEMAAIPNATKTGIAITHVAGRAPCNGSAGRVTDAGYEPPAADLKPPVGQLTGALSFVNVNQGMLASTPPTVIQNFWRTDAAAAAPRVWAATAAAPELTTGGNRFVNLPRYNADANVASESHYVAEFANSIDAVSALLTVKKVSTEYAYTSDGVVSSSSLFSFPTKQYYVFSSSLGPFQSNWNQATQESCDVVEAESYDREATVGSALPRDDFSAGRPPEPWRMMCFAVNGLAHGRWGGDRNSPLTKVFPGIQNGGAEVVVSGAEGGWLELYSVSTQAQIVAVAATAVQRVAGTLTLTPVSLTLQGLPVIGFTMTQSAYKTGSPQQNFGDITPLRREPGYAETR